MGYALIVGSKANAQSQADFESAVENVGGAAVCIGGVAVYQDVVVQAVNQSGSGSAMRSTSRPRKGVVADAKKKRRRKGR